MRLRCRAFAIICSLFLCAGSASSQVPFLNQFSFGVVGGAALTRSVVLNPSNFTLDSARKYIIGGSVEYALPFGLSVEGDVLFHPFNIEVGTKPPPAFTVSTLYDYRVFEIPVVAKARFTSGLLRPFVEAGINLRNPNKLEISHYGFVAGAGLDIGKKRLLRISPQIRYVRWGPDSLIVQNASKSSGEQLNQLYALLGISF